MSTLRQVKQKTMTLALAAAVMRVSYRQAKRLWKRYNEQGDAGLVHQSRGRPSARRAPEATRQRALDLYQRKYPDFGPTLAAEHLAKDGVSVDHETLRRWLGASGLWKARKGRGAHRQRRERKGCFGQMLQLDGSHHHWFEGRGPKAVMMVLIDDATNRTYARFFPEETTRASYDTFEGWVRRHGVPSALYVDRDSIYRTEGTPSIAEQLEGRTRPQTQFQRAMERLGVELILAHSPQAKGRVERRHQVMQDRLVKALRLEGISDLEEANRYLEKTFLPDLNRRFTVKAASDADAHRPVPRDLDDVLSWEESRIVQKDWTVDWQCRSFQLDRRHEGLSLAGKRVTVRMLRDERLQLIYKDQKLHWRELPKRPTRTVEPKVEAPQPPKPETKPGATRRPGRNHPWRKKPWGKTWKA